jgi:hypothetical protein
MAVSLATILLIVAPAAAEASLLVSPSTSAPGKSVQFTGSVPTSGAASCPAGDSVTLVATAALFPGDGFGPQAQRDASGDFIVVYTIPQSTPAGSYSIGMRCGGGNVGVAATLTVLSGAPQAGLGGASRGEGNPVPWIAGGLAAIAAAAILSATAIRRRRA